MGLSRQFLNLIVYDNPITTWSLRCMDLRRLQLFHPDLTAVHQGLSSPKLHSKTMTSTVIPSPTFSFKPTRSEPVGKPNSVVGPWSSRCVPIGGRKVLCMDAGGRSLLFDADTRQVVTMPTFILPRFRSVYVFVSSADSHGDPDPDGTLFILPEWPLQESSRDPSPQSPQFDALVYRATSTSSRTKSWYHQHFAPYPYLRVPKYRKVRPEITSYAVLGGGSHICVSADGAGTYCLDTVSHAWSKVGDWLLPFKGKAEYAPELNLWFGNGIYKDDVGHPYATEELVAADLSTLDSEPKPEVVGTWQELDQMPIHSNNGPSFYTCSRSELVYLGSRKFCIARFLKAHYDYGRHPPAGHPRPDSFVVFTGVEVIPHVLRDTSSGGGEHKCLLMFGHKSRVVPRYINRIF